MNNKIIMPARLIISLFIFFGTTITAYSQTLDKANELIGEGDFEGARQMGFDILKSGYDPDVALMIGRTYAWQEKYDSARIYIGEVLHKFPSYFEGLKAIIDVEFWSGNYSRALEYCDKALDEYKVGTFYLKKSEILNTIEKKKEAAEILKIYLAENPDDKDSQKKMKLYKFESKKNEIRYSYTLDKFNEKFDRNPWQVNSLQYKRDTKAGAIIARINYANRFNKTGYQLELDLYPKLNDKNYFYINYGYSNASVFPENKAGLEWFHSFKNKFETSAGIRLLMFENSNVDFYTVMIGKYLKNNLFSLRTFVTPEKEVPSFTAILETRHFFTNQENYLALKLGYGTSPDELRNLIDTPQRLSVKSQWLRMEYNQLVAYSWLFGLNFTLGREERIAGEYAGYYSIETRLSFLF